jgi:hypothetical protein
MEEYCFRKSHASSPLPEEAAPASSSYIGFERHDTYAAFAAGTEDAILVRERPGGASEVNLASTSTPSHTAFDGSGFYNSGLYRWGRLTSAAYETTTRFDTLIPSWRATTPAGTWLELEVRVRSCGAWTQWFGMGVWGTGSVERYSVDGQEERSWQVLTDTLRGTGPVFADAYRYRLTLFSEERGVSPAVRDVWRSCLGFLPSWGVS